MKVGVLLAGCGVEDGSEIYESVLTILALERGGATVQALAPDVEQAEVVNHYRGGEDRVEMRSWPGETARSVLAESARIVRGKIISVNEVSAHDIDALVIPGGYGVVKNLCTFASDDANANVNPEVERLIHDLNALGKPIGAICAAPILVALCLRDKKPTMTMGTDGAALMRVGASHAVTGVNDIYVDTANNVVSTAAFMLANSVSEAEPGITQLVNQVLQMARALGPGHRGSSTITGAA